MGIILSFGGKFKIRSPVDVDGAQATLEGNEPVLVPSPRKGDMCHLIFIGNQEHL